jgi:Thymidylate synthase
VTAAPLPAQDLPDADAAFRRTLSDVLVHGDEIGVGDRTSVDLANYPTTFLDMRARIVTNSVRRLDSIGAVARFVWMIAGNDRLADIAFYAPQVKGYTDDGLTVPGSSYGQRLRRPSPGLDQLPGVVERLRRDPSSRQAAAVIWSPEDAVRVSNDIPCAFGVFYRIRDGLLEATTVMRSNNAFRLLPFNMFEFSMLAELVAAELDVGTGPYVHWAASMHLLDQLGERGKARSLVQGPESLSAVMPQMPSDGSPLEAARLLAAAEADLRHAQSASRVLALRDETSRLLGDYWMALFDVLALHALRLHGADREAAELRLAIPAYLSDGIRDVPSSAPADDVGQLFLVDMDEAAGSGAVKIESAMRGQDDSAQALARVVAKYETDSADRVSHEEFASLLTSVDGYALAARSDGGAGGLATADDRFLPLDELRARLAALRSG